MLLKTKKFSILVITVIAIYSFMFLGAVRIFETGNINADGSGTLAITYSASTSEVKVNNNLMGNFPFTQQAAKEYFSSANVQVKSSKVYKNQNDTSMTSVTVVMDFKNINDLGELKGFSGNKIRYNKIDGKSKHFRWDISPEAASNIERLICELTFECESVSSSVGIVKGKTVVYNKDSKKSDFSKTFFLGATVQTDGKTQTSTEESGKKPDGEGKSCGLFGLELPVLLLVGLILSKKFKK